MKRRKDETYRFYTGGISLWFWLGEAVLVAVILHLAHIF